MEKPSIIIIGAGASALMAAKVLAPHYTITILEAMPRTGGRIHTILQQGDIIDAGPAFIHGELPLTLNLLNEAGIKYEKAAGILYRNKNTKFLPVAEMTEGWDGLLEKMRSIKDDLTLQQLLDKYYDAPGYKTLRLHVQSYAEGFDLAEPGRVSVKALYEEWAAGNENSYRIPQGYSQLVEYLVKTLSPFKSTVITGTIVNNIIWRKGHVTVQSSDGNSFHAEKLLVTVPVSVLQQSEGRASIQFEPAIHFNKDIVNRIGFGKVIKVILKFKKIFWQEDAGFILSDELFPTWWTELPGVSPILTGWLGGPGAERISDDTDENLQEKALRSLAAIFDISIIQLKEWLIWGKVFNWQKNEFVMGGYSFSTPESESAKNLISTPLENTIFFAGEGLYEGPYPGTVEAALVSGKNAASAILQQKKTS